MNDRYDRNRSPRTNVQIVRDMMERSDYGALAQAFVMEAIYRYAKECSDMTIEQMRDAFGPSPMISPESWHGVSQEVLRKIQNRI